MFLHATDTSARLVCALVDSESAWESDCARLYIGRISASYIYIYTCISSCLYILNSKEGKMRPATKLIVLVAISYVINSALASPSRHDRVWPVGGTTMVDLAQSSPFGPRLQASQTFR